MNNITEFNKSIDKLIIQLEVAAQQTIKQLSELAVIEAQNTTTFNNTLKESTQFKMNGAFTSEVFDNRSYAYYLEEGNDQNGAYIYPVSAKAFHFFINGEEIFATKVKSHTGYHFIEHGKDIAAQNIEEIFNRNFNK